MVLGQVTPTPQDTFTPPSPRGADWPPLQFFTSPSPLPPFPLSSPIPSCLIHRLVEYCLRSRSADRQMDRLRDRWTRQIEVQNAFEMGRRAKQKEWGGNLWGSFLCVCLLTPYIKCTLSDVHTECKENHCRAFVLLISTLVYHHVPPSTHLTQQW